MNESDRKKFYDSTSDDWGDDGVEYEVEPPDADVIALQKRTAEEQIKHSEYSIDPDEIYRNLSRPSPLDKTDSWPDDFRFRFQVKHLLIATAVLAVLLTMWRLRVLVNVIGVLLLSAMAAVLAYTELKEQQRAMEAERAWQEKLRRRRQYLEQMGRQRGIQKPGPSTIYDDVPFDGEDLPERPAPADPPFRLQFSLRQLFIGMTLASVVLGLVTLLGGPAILAMVLGVLALGGLVVHAFGAQLPPVVVLGWWLVLVLYVVLGLATELGKLF